MLCWLADLELVLKGAVNKKLLLACGDNKELVIEVVEAILPRATAEGCPDGDFVPHVDQFAGKDDNVQLAVLLKGGSLQPADFPQQLQ